MKNMQKLGCKLPLNSYAEWIQGKFWRYPLTSSPYLLFTSPLCWEAKLRFWVFPRWVINPKEQELRSNSKQTKHFLLSAEIIPTSFLEFRIRRINPLDENISLFRYSAFQNHKQPNYWPLLVYPILSFDRNIKQH